MIELDRRALIEDREGEGLNYRQAFNQLVRTLLQMLPREHFMEIGVDVADIYATDPSTYVKTTAEQGLLWQDSLGHWGTFSQLSDGYQSTMSWTGDLVSRLSRAYPKSENFLE